MYTKEELRLIIEMWNEHSIDEIASKVKVKKTSISSIAKKLRVNGFPLHKKHRNGVMDGLIKELKAEYKIK